MTDFPDLKLKAQISLPARINGGIGIDTTRSNGVYTIDLAFDELAPVSTIPAASGTTTFVALWDQALNSYRRISASDFHTTIGNTGSISVTAFGALGNGVADDTAAINNAIIAADAAGVSTVVLGGMDSVHMVSSSVRMRPGIRLLGPGTIKQQATSNLVALIDMNINSATGSKLELVTIDGNAANQTAGVNDALVLIYDCSDVTVQNCALQNGTAYGILVHDGIRPAIVGNTIINTPNPISLQGTTGLSQNSTIYANTISVFKQHAIIVAHTVLHRILNNYIVAVSTRGFNVNTSGTTVTATSGTPFTTASVGTFLILNGGTERLITGFTSSTVVTVNTTLGVLTGVPAAWGNGDIISMQGVSAVECRNNRVTSGASLGISLFSDGTSNCVGNVITDNFSYNMGSAGISIQVSGNQVVDTIISRNYLESSGQNGTASAPAANVGVFVDGAGSVTRIIVANNIIPSYGINQLWGINFTSTSVVSRIAENNLVSGSTNTTNGGVNNP